MNSTYQSRRNQRGVSVVEGLVAIFVFGVVFLAALMLYSSANRAYLSTDATTIQQQNVRFAMDRMGESLRDAGANFNALGSRTLPDEQIEGAWESAIFVRGDFDNARETPLESTTYPIVTTGNDEIVGYVLRKPVPASGPDPNTITISVKADLRPTVRDAAIASGAISGEETGSITVAATTLAQQTNPPYQLVRVTFAADGAAVTDVIADNVFRLSFNYLAADGAVAVTTFGSDDAQRAARAAVRRVDVNLIGMTDRPDLGYTDPNTYVPAESSSTRRFRKFSLSEQIVMPNMGVIGRRHQVAPQLTIAAPPSLTVCTGHCRNFHIRWTASPTAGVSQYMLHITAPASGSNAAYSDTVPVNGLSWEFEQPDSELRTYSFAVAALVSGVEGTLSSVASAAATHDTTNSVPSAPASAAAAVGTVGRNTMTVTWPEVTTNVGTLAAASCTTVGTGAGTSSPPAPWNNRAVDLALDDAEGSEAGSSYKVYRVRSTGTNSNFTPAVANQIDSGPAIGSVTNTPPTSGNFVDNTAAPCASYFYKVQACDLCGINGAASPAMAAASFFVPASGVTPRAPSTLLPVNTPVISGGNYTFQLTWPYVTTTTANEQAVAAHYILERYRALAAAGPYTLIGTEDIYDSNVSATQTLPTEIAGVPTFYRFYVRAQYDCGNYSDTNRTSAASPAYDLACTPPSTNTISLATPVVNTAISRPYETGTPIRAVTTGAAWTGAQVQITGVNGSVYDQALSGPPVSNAYTFPAWDVSTLPDGVYTIALVGIAGSCRSPVFTRTVSVETNTCGLEIINAAFRGSGGNYAETMTFNIRNTCDAANLSLNGMTPSWTGTATNLKITRIAAGTTYYNNSGGATSGSLISFGSNATINASTTSAEFTFSFNDNFTSDGTRDGTPGQFNSILGRLVTPANSTDELLSGTRIP